jgi:2,3-bisphosphoglycerate-dependent phosphoglycerate mutase
MKNTTIYVVRHAESAHNRSGSLSQEPGTLYGTLGSALTEEGKRQASQLARSLKDLKVHCIFASHLIRAKQTAEILGVAFGLPVHITETLQERLDTESEAEAGFRLFTSLQEIVHTYREQTILVVSHGAILRGMLMILGFANAPELPPGSVANTGYVVLETDGEQWSIADTNGIVRVL